MPSRVLVAEQIAPRGIEALKAAGLDVDERLDLGPDQLLEAVHDAAALIVRSATPVTAEVLAAAAELVVVGRAGIGLDNVDVAAATRRGVMVVNAPQSNVLSAAEHTIALLLAQARNIPQADRDLRSGELEPVPVGGRRAARQDARRRRTGPRRRARSLSARMRSACGSRPTTRT